MKCLSIIIPFLNEAGTIQQIIEEIVALENFPYTREVIFVNDGSTDESAAKVLECQEILSKNNIASISLRNEKNKGKGFSCKAGISVARGDYYMIQDADLEYSPKDYILLLQLLETENLDFVYGSRNRGFSKNGFHFSYFSFLLGGLFLSLLTSLAVQKWISDEPTCYKLFRSSLKDSLLFPEENGFEWEPAITVILCKKGYKYGETGISYFPRKIEAGKKIRWSDGLKAIKTIVKWSVYHYKK